LRHIAGQFFDPATQVEISPISTGLINDTFLIEKVDTDEKFVLQKINQLVFPEPEKLMDNLVCIVNHLSKRPDPRYKLLKLVKTRSDNDFFVDSEDEYWRLFEYLDDTRNIDQITNPVQALEAARAFGNFIKRLDDLDTRKVKETIKDFHNYQSRIIKLRNAAREDTRSRTNHCDKELDFIEKRFHYINTIYSLNLPVRVIHSDTKIDNILFDSELKKAVCVIDLDIAMPGTVLYDYGDMVRSYTNTLKEDDPDLSGIEIDHDIFVVCL
jgi:aminoglycoside phosphotransferase (APT) family kinase protein